MMLGTLMPWTTFRGLSPLDREIDDLFGRFFVDREEDRPAWPRTTAWYPQVESYVEGDKIVVKADLPGVDPKEVDVSVLGNQLTIRGERKAEREKKEGQYFHREVRYGSFERSVALPEGMNAEQIDARYHDGVLEISMPVPKRLTSQRISVETR